MPTPNGVNDLLQFLNASSNSPIIGIQESKVDVHLMSLCCCYVTIRYFVLRVRPYVTFANIGKNLQSSKKMREKLQKCLDLSEFLSLPEGNDIIVCKMSPRFSISFQSKTGRIGVIGRKDRLTHLITSHR